MDREPKTAEVTCVKVNKWSRMSESEQDGSEMCESERKERKGGCRTKGAVALCPVCRVCEGRHARLRTGTDSPQTPTHAPRLHVARAEGRTPREHCRGRWTASPPSSAAPLSPNKRAPSPLGTAARSTDTPPRAIRETNRGACLSPATHRERSPHSSPHIHNPRLFFSFLFFFPPLSSFIRSLLCFHFVRSLGTLC